MLKIIRRFHNEKIKPKLFRSVTDCDFWIRFLGGISITVGLAIATTFLLPHLLLSAHGFYDFEFASDKVFTAWMVFVFFTTAGFVGLFTICLVLFFDWHWDNIRRTGVKKTKAVDWYLAFCLLFAATVLLSGMLFSIYFESNGRTFAIVAIVFALVLTIRWLINDAAVSNYLTAFFALTLISIVSLFPAQTAGALIKIVLRPAGLSGLHIDIVAPDRPTESRCLVLASVKNIWVVNKTGPYRKIESIPRDGVRLIIPRQDFPIDKKNLWCASLENESALR